MKRFPELDGMRGLFAMLVVMVHARVESVYWLITFMDGFFALSAFLITLGLLEDRSPTRGALLRRFYWRRSARIFPAYYTLLLGVAVLMLLINALGPKAGLTEHWSLGALLPYLVYLQFTDLFTQHTEATAFLHEPRYLWHTWSLAVEEQFYLLWGLLFAFARSRSARFAAGLAFIAVGVAARASGIVDSPLITYRLDAFGNGIIGALLYHRIVRQPDPVVVESERRRYGRTAGLALLAAVVLFWLLAGIPQAYWRWLTQGVPPDPDSMWTPASIFSAFGCGALVFALACNTGARALRVLCWRPLRHAGRISYCLYLIHFPIVDVLLRHERPLMHFGHAGNVLAVMVLCLGLAHFATRFFDWVNLCIVNAVGAGSRAPLPIPPPRRAAATPARAP